jgi:hypothetical protein
MLEQIKKHFFDALVRSANNYLNTFDSKSGRFLENGGWAVTLQDAVLAYAYLYTTEKEGNPFYKDEKIYNVILKGIQALRNFQYPDGQFEFIKTDGSKWGPIYMPWTFYHWLETYEIMKNYLPDDVRCDWGTGLIPAFISFSRRDNKHLHNIPLWDSMSLHRAGIIFNNEDWKKHADVLFQKATEKQHPDGYWEEHGGPTVSYNRVYMHAMGLYKFHGGRINVTETLRKSAMFHQAFTYPDGSSVETIDGRVKYRKTEKIRSTTGLTGLLATSAGVSYIHAFLNFFSQDRISLPHTTSLLIMLDNINEDFIDKFAGYENFANDKLELLHGQGSIIRKNNRQVVLSSYTAPFSESRWALDRQSFISVWDKNISLILGSGNSKYQPDHSSFVICGKDGRIISYMPVSARHISLNEVELLYYGARCTIKAQIDDSGAILITYCAQKAEDILSWYINVPLKAQFISSVAELKEYKQDDKNVIEFSGIRLSFSEDYRITAPSFPFNPYAIDSSAGIDEAIAVLTIYPKKDSISIRIV